MELSELQYLTETLRRDRKEDLTLLKESFMRELDQRFEGVTKFLEDHEPRIRTLERTRSWARGVSWAVGGAGGIFGLLKGLTAIGVIPK